MRLLYVLYNVPQKRAITQRLRTELGQWGWVSTVIQLVLDIDLQARTSHSLKHMWDQKVNIRKQISI